MVTSYAAEAIATARVLLETRPDGRDWVIETNTMIDTQTKVKRLHVYVMATYQGPAHELVFDEDASVMDIRLGVRQAIDHLDHLLICAGCKHFAGR